MTPTDMLREYHRAFGGLVPDAPTPLSPEAAALRLALLTEELDEVAVELQSGDLVRLAHELADLVYVSYGTAVSVGIDLDAVLAEVHASNMTKIGPDGRFEMREDGKVLKGTNHRPPDVAGILSNRAAHLAEPS
ncbi:MAG: MazG nucleotide pyrophosphohydrolase domain-containing protein [Dehalococcoidia bacterium]